MTLPLKLFESIKKWINCCIYQNKNTVYPVLNIWFCCVICRFSLVKEHLIEFNQLAMANAEGSDEMLNRVMTKDNIGLAALLETKEGVFDSSGRLNLCTLVFLSSL